MSVLVQTEVCQATSLLKCVCRCADIVALMAECGHSARATHYLGAVVLVSLCCCDGCHCLVATVALRWCHCLGVIVPLCVTVLLSQVSLSCYYSGSALMSLCCCHIATLCHCVAVTVSLCCCHCVTVLAPLCLRWCHCVGVIASPCVTVLLSQVSLSWYHCVSALVSLCWCHSATLCHCVAVNA